MQVDKPEPIHGLTGIRGVAALWVVLYHMRDMIGYVAGLQQGHGIPILRDGFRGVDLFFILSGFIMMHVHQADFRVITAHGVSRFFALRFIRVYPLNTVVLVLIVVLVVPLPGFVEWCRHFDEAYINAYSARGFLQTLFLANRWLPHDYGVWNTPTWSLSVELVAYIFFPALAFLVLRERSPARCMLYTIGSLAFLVMAEIELGYADVNIMGRLAIIRALACFSAGVTLYRLVSLTGRRNSAAIWPSVLSIITCIALFAMLLVPHGGVLAPFGFAALIGALFHQRGAVDRVLRGPTALFFGKISFALYLVHFVPCAILYWMIDSRIIGISGRVAVGMALPAVLALCIVVSALLHRFVEGPAQRAGRRLLERHSMPVSSVTSVSHGR